MLLLPNLLLCDSGGIQFATFQLPHLEIMDCGMTICDPNMQNPTADENNCKLQKTSASNVHFTNQKLIIKHSRVMASLALLSKMSRMVTANNYCIKT